MLRGERDGQPGRLGERDHVDVGGGAPASIGAFQEVFQEGVIIPPVRVVRAGRIVDDAHRIAKERGGNLLDIMKELVQDFLKKK